ncbi:hypothetical protein J6590_059907 [Homalodisca vitripennis]|nr:hypothetical protein J6590_059907 [Homalodisca vitripennis]
MFFAVNSTSSNGYKLLSAQGMETLQQFLRDHGTECIRQFVQRVRQLSRDNRIKQRRAWLLLGWVAAERFCPCKQPACPAIGPEVKC